MSQSNTFSIDTLSEVMKFLPEREALTVRQTSKDFNEALNISFKQIPSSRAIFLTEDWHTIIDLNDYIILSKIALTDISGGYFLYLDTDEESTKKRFAWIIMERVSHSYFLMVDGTQVPLSIIGVNDTTINEHMINYQQTYYGGSGIHVMSMTRKIIRNCFGRDLYSFENVDL